MQSVLQYRRFRTAIKAQLERDGVASNLEKKGDAPQETGGIESPSSSTSDKSRIDGSDVDVEKQTTHGNPTVGPNDDVMQKDFQEPVEDPGHIGAGEEEDDDEEEEDDYELGGNRTLSRSTTQSTGHRLGNILTGVEVRRRTTREGGDGDVFVVGYESDDDPLNPQNWSYVTRVRCTLTVAAIGCVVGFASAIDSAVIDVASKALHVSPIVESLATSLFLIGFGTGALFAGPFSETFGRNPIYLATLGLYMIFIMASGLAPNIEAQLVFRFFAGVFGSTPLTCAGGSISDMWSPMERVITFPIFANAAFTGPLLGPVVGGWIAQSTVVSWRWVEWTTLIFSGVVLAIVVLFQPETFPPVLMKWKAKHLRDLTGDQRYKGSLEIRDETLLVKLRRALYRPFLLTFREPIVVLVALYLTVIYIVLFGFLEGFTYVFADTYGLSDGLTGLCFLAIIVGLFISSGLVPLIYKWAKQELRKAEEEGRSGLKPEFRMWYSMLGGSIAIPVSLFWMAWTTRPDISIWSPLIAAVFFGYGTLGVFISSYQYVIDSYETYAASALASVTLIRYIASGVMTTVAIPWYSRLGVPYTLTILASISAALAPLPYVFYKYGHLIRAKSKYAVTKK